MVWGGSGAGVDDWKFQVLSRSPPPDVIGLSAIPITGKKKKREKRAAKNGRGDGAIARTEEKLGDSIMSPTKDRPLIAQLTCSLVPPSVSLSSHSPSLGLCLLEKIFTKLWGLSASLGLLKKLPV